MNTTTQTTRENEMTNQTAAEQDADNLTWYHHHNLGITISVGDLAPAQLVTMRAILEREVAAIVERVNTETAALTGQTVNWSVTYDGLRECGEH